MQGAEDLINKHIPVHGTVYTTPPGLPFCTLFADFLLKHHGVQNNPLALTGVTVWLPTRRAVLAMGAALLERGGDALVLPQLRAAMPEEGDIATLAFAEAPATVTPPGTPAPQLGRLLYLAKLVQKFRETTMPVTASQAVALAQALLALSDRLVTYGIDTGQLEALVPDDLAHHWQRNLAFLRLVLENMPQWYAETGTTDPAHWQNQILRRQGHVYAQKGLQGPTYGAGFTDTTPAGLAVLRGILSDPKGAVIIPACDAGTLGKPLPQTHPYSSIQALLQGLGVPAQDLKPLMPEAVPHPRVDLLHRALRADGFGQTQPPPQNALEGLTLIEAESTTLEAQAIALLLREVAHTPGKTCALVTPDRVLATRVTDILAAEGVELNDSAGQGLDTCPAGRFFMATAQLVAQRWRPLAVARLMAHPFTRCGCEAGVWKVHARALEGAALRGPAPGVGVMGLKAVLNQLQTPDLHAEKALNLLQQAMVPLADLRGAQPLSTWLEAHLACAQNLCAEPVVEGETPTIAQPFFKQNDGEALANLLQQMARQSHTGGPMVFADYVAVLQAMMEKTPVRAGYGRHPRLWVWGPLEARLQQADRMIIAGLNEGTWPKEAAPDPWLSPGMAAALGLPGVDSVVGRNGHDFFSLAAAPEVFLTRTALKNGEALTPSRYWVRLQAQLVPHGQWQALIEAGKKWVRLAKQLHAPDAFTPLPAAVANPAAARRPTLWSASTLTRLVNCPYQAYLAKIGHVNKLDGLEESPDAALKGEMMHLALQAFFMAPAEVVPGLPGPWQGPVTTQNASAAAAHLQNIGKAVLAHRVASPAQRQVWQARFEAMAESFIRNEAAQQAEGRTPWALEERGQYTLGPVTLHARADRIDASAEGMVVVDYKTGQPPTAKKVKAGRAPQLTVEGLLLRKGAYQNSPQALQGLEFWNIGKGDIKIEKALGKKAEAADIGVLVDEAEQGIARLADHFITHAAPMPATPGGRTALDVKGPCRLCDYAGICRFREWQGREEAL